jgi:hypothetical protein
MNADHMFSQFETVTIIEIIESYLMVCQLYNHIEYIILSCRIC